MSGNIAETLGNLVHQTAFFNLTWGNYLMIAVACVFLYLAIKKGYERKPDQFSLGSSRTVRYFCRVSAGYRIRFFRCSSCSSIHHRWCRWTDFHLPGRKITSK